jgi:uncharacterized protein (TIGR00297 family)
MALPQYEEALRWQSKAVLLLVAPWTALDALYRSYWWAIHAPVVAWTTLGISGVFGLIVWRLRAGTAAAAATGAIITASLMYGTARIPYEWSWLHGGLLPLLTLFILTFAATKVGKAKKERLGTAEGKRGRNAAQVAANLGAAALATSLPVTPFAPNAALASVFDMIAAFAALTALSEAAADTVSSEIGQIFGGEPRLITTLRQVPKGSDGGITLLGTVAGAVAALVVMMVGFSAMYGACQFLSYWVFICLGAVIAVLGLLFDSLLGATLERRGWLNNDAVNFLSTLSAVVIPFAIGAAVLALAAKTYHPSW